MTSDAGKFAIALIETCETIGDLRKLIGRIGQDTKHYPSQWDDETKEAVRAAYKRRWSQLSERV